MKEDDIFCKVFEYSDIGQVLLISDTDEDRHVMEIIFKFEGMRVSVKSISNEDDDSYNSHRKGFINSNEENTRKMVLGLIENFSGE